jgi:hypothetical protein
MPSGRWDADDRGRGVADARSHVGAINELAGLAGAEDWVAEEPEKHLLPGLNDRVAISGLTLDEVAVDGNGSLLVRLTSATRLSRREIRQSVWSILGGAVEMTTHVHESIDDGVIGFDVVTGTTPGGAFATHGHTLRVEVVQPS